MKEWVYHEGRFELMDISASIPFNDYPMIYEVVRIIDTEILFFEDHFLRFSYSRKDISNAVSIREEEVHKNLRELISRNNIQNGNVKFGVLTTTESCQFFSHRLPHHYPEKNEYQFGINTQTFSAVRDNPNIKKYNKSLRDEVDAILRNSNNYEVLYVDHQGYVTEGSRSNLFMISGSKVITPPLKTVLPGITRKKVFEICKQGGIEILEANIHQNQLIEFDAAFISGTSPKILPIKKINSNIFDPSNKVLVRIMESYDHLIENYLLKNKA